MQDITDNKYYEKPSGLILLKRDTTKLKQQDSIITDKKIATLIHL